MSRSRLRSERGQSSAEYLGVILVVAAIIAAIFASGLGGTIHRGIESAICSIGGGGCGEGSGAASGPGGLRPGAGAGGAAVVPPVGDRPSGGRDGTDSGPGRGSPTDRGPDGRSGPGGERPRDSGDAGPDPQGGGPGSQAPASGVEFGSDGADVPDPFDPPPPDPGAGAYDSEGVGVADRLNKEKWYAVADAAEALGLADAARHMRHYLDNSGEPLEVDVDRIIHDEENLRRTAGNLVNVAAAEALASYDGNGPADIPFRTGWAGFYAEDRNWYYGLGGMWASATGVVHIEPGNPPRATVTYRVHIHDRYNWDGGKHVDIGPWRVEDTELQKLHRKGLAQEFDVNGTSDEIRVTIDPSNPGGAAPSGDGSRNGGRGDPGRSRG